MIQEILPLELNNSYTEALPVDNSPVICFKDRRILVSVNELARTMDFPRWRVLKGPAPVYLFSIGEEKYFLIMDPDERPDGFDWYDLRALREKKMESRWKLFAAFTGLHLWNWYQTNRFCGACGCKTVQDHTERALVCPSCGNRIYPRINPAVIIGVTNGDSLLLTKYNRGYAHNALVAGFTEIGETLEQTVCREVKEEVGLRVKNIRYYKSQPWGIASDILMGFYCDVDGEDVIKMDNHELKYAAWVKREEIELQPTDDSLTNEMMKLFKFGGPAAVGAQ